MNEKKKYVILIFLISILFGVVRYQMIVWPTGGVFFFPSDDSYISLRYAKKVIEGHPLSINPGEPPAPLEPSFIIPFVYGAPFLFTSYSPSAVSSFAYWINILFLSFTLIVIFLLLIRSGFSYLYALIITSICLLYNPFRYLFTIDMGWGLFTLSFYLFLYFFLFKDNFWLVLPGILIALSRPEAFYIIGFFMLFALFEKKIKKLLIILIPFIFNMGVILFYLIITKMPYSSGFSPQFLFTHYNFASGISVIITYIMDYLKGIFLGFYPLNTKTYNFVEYHFSPLPPLFFVFVCTGYWWIFRKNENKQIYILFSLLFPIVLFISSLTIYQGVHLLRHTAWLMPFIIFIGVKGIQYLEKIWRLKNWILLFYFSFFFIFFIDFLIAISSGSIYNTLPYFDSAKWIENNLQKRNLIGIVNSRTDFFIKKDARYYNLTPGDNWRIARYERGFDNFAIPYELLKYEIDKEKEWYAVWGKEDESTFHFEYVTALTDTPLYKKVYLFDRYIKIAPFKIEPFINSEKIYLPGNFQIVDEVDIGDPVSEREHKYNYFVTLPYGKVKFLPLIGKLEAADGDSINIIEGGVLSQYEKFNFYLDEFPNDTMFLIARLASKIKVISTTHIYRNSGEISLTNQNFDIFLNKEKIDSVRLEDINDFNEYSFLLPAYLLKKGENEVEIVGLHIPLRWVIAHPIARE